MTERDAPISPALLLIGIGFGAMIGTFISATAALLVLASLTTVIGLLLLILWWRG